MPHQQGQAATRVLRNEVLHIHLFYLVNAIRIDLSRNPALSEINLFDGFATDDHFASANVERAHLR